MFFEGGWSGSEFPGDLWGRCGERVAQAVMLLSHSVVSE